MALHPSIQALVDDIEAFRARTGMSVTAFGTAALNDPNFIGDLRRGRMPSLVLIDRVREFMKQGADAA